MSSEAHFFFIFRKSSVLFAKNLLFSIFNHLLICQICDVMVNISTWDRVHFWIYLLNYDSLSHQTWPFDKYKLGQKISRIWKIGRSGASFQVLFNLASCSNYSINNYFKIQVLQFFEKVKNKRQLKMVNVNY